MKTALTLFAVGWFVTGASSSLAVVHYVDPNSTNATPPYANWTTAATNIQDAVDGAAAGDEILVTNGVYATGGRAGQRVTVDRAVTLRSVSGPTFTIIDGGRSVGCVYLTNGALLSGFTITKGIGAGVFCESQLALLSNCVLSSNACFSGDSGGGVYGGTLNNCALIGNMAHLGGGAAGCILNGCFLSGNVATAHNEPGEGGGAFNCILNNCALSGNWGDAQGGGAAECTLNDCTLTGNRAWLGGGGASGGTLNNCTVTGNCPSGVSALFSVSDHGGGVRYPATLNNCIVYFNDGWNYDTSSLNYCCTTPLPTNGVGNIASDPLFMNTNGWSNLRLGSTSPCINSGSNAYALGDTDLDGHPRILGGAVDIGAYEFQFTTRYVDANNQNPMPPYTNWTTSATNIQDAVDASFAGDEIVVTNGVYSNGGRAVGMGVVTNRLVVDKPLMVRSVNGPQYTTIDGDFSVRCVYLATGATLSGLTLTNGFVQYDGGGGLFCETNTLATDCVLAGNSADHAVSGGVYGGILRGCVLIGNSSFGRFESGAGGGAYASTLYDCVINNNSADTGGGVSGCALSNCTLSMNYAIEGGGASGSFLSNCKLSGNVANGVNANNGFGGGGGVSDCTLSNCTLCGNYATEGGGAFGSFLINCKLSENIASGVHPLRGRGGGASESTLNNCTLTRNLAQEGEAGPLGNVQGGGAYHSYLYNCTLSGNSVTGPPEILVGGGASDCTVYNCIFFNNTNLDHCEDCSSPGLLLTNQNWSGEPGFTDWAGGDLRLQSNSPCINGGWNAFAPAGTDLDGNPRIRGGTVDIGAYEFQSPTSLISYAWLRRYNLPTDGSADYMDPDGDGLNNWQEWCCGTDPTNPNSALRLLSADVTSTNVTVSWQSVAGVNYFLERGTDLIPALSFVPLAAGIVGQSGVTTYADTNVLGFGLVLYRVGVMP